MNIFYANASHENWIYCKKHNIFGLRKRQPFPDISTGDIILVRVTGKPYGVKAIWVYKGAEKVTDNTFVPWEDAEYDWILKCDPLIEEFSVEFSEAFATRHKRSTKIDGLYASTIMGTLGKLNANDAAGYLHGILDEKVEELQAVSLHDDPEKSVYDYISSVLEDIDTSLGDIPEAKRSAPIQDDSGKKFQQSSIQEPVPAIASESINTIWCIYVENDALNNFNIGLTNGVWGTNYETRFKPVRHKPDIDGLNRGI